MSRIEFKELSDPLGSSYFQGILQLQSEVFDIDSSGVREIAELETGLLAHVALADDKVVGFKLGYQKRPRKFYSWLGSVDPDYRRQGIARELMTMQHQSLKNLGFVEVHTKTKNKHRSMLLLNIISGFNITGCYTDEQGEPKIMFQKDL